MKWTNDTVKIKRLTKDDATEINAKTLWEVAESGFQNGSVWTADQFLQTLTASNSIVLAATLIEDDTKKIVGLLVASRTTIESDIYMIVVAEDYKQRGLGRKLLEALIETCQMLGLETIFLEVRETNLPALSLYKSLDFKEIGRRKGYYSKPTEDGLMMKLDL